MTKVGVIGNWNIWRWIECRVQTDNNKNVKWKTILSIFHQRQIQIIYHFWYCIGKIAVHVCIQTKAVNPSCSAWYDTEHNRSFVYRYTTWSRNISTKGQIRICREKREKIAFWMNACFCGLNTRQTAIILKYCRFNKNMMEICSVVWHSNRNLSMWKLIMDQFACDCAAIQNGKQQWNYFATKDAYITIIYYR